MGLKRTGNYLYALAYGAIALAMLCIEVTIVAHIATQLLAPGGMAPFAWLGLVFGGIFGLFVMIVNVLIGAAAFAAIARQRGIRAAAAHDSRGAPPATYQPEIALALRGGETLELMWTQRSGGIGQLVKVFVVLVFLALFLDFAVLLSLPAINPLNSLDVLGLFGTQTSTSAPTLLDWVTLAYPLLFCLGLFVAAVPASLIGRRQRIAADDQGITLDVSGRRRRFIPWNDIVVFARPTDNKSASPVGSYLIWGREHGLPLQIGMKRTQTRDPNLSVSQEDIYTFDGGYETYEANARRLLATITARSGMPLRTFAGNTALLRKMNRRFPVQTMEMEDALAAPVADANWQPSPEALAAAGRFEAAATLRERIAVLPTLVEAVVYAVICGAIVAAVMVLPYLSKPYMLFWTGLPPLATAGIVAFAVLLVLAAGAGLAFGRRATHHPPISADEEGLHTRVAVSGSSSRVVTLPWASVRAWGVLPTVPGSRRPTTYFAFSEDQKVTWKEPDGARLAGRGVRGDRRAAYRERAQELHGLIAAKTGLPLKMLAASDIPAMASQMTETQPLR